MNSIAKIFDKLLYNRRIKFFETNSLLNKYQFGFRENKGIEHATLNLNYYINDANKNNLYLVIIFIDLRLLAYLSRFINQKTSTLWYSWNIS